MGHGSRCGFVRNAGDLQALDRAHGETCKGSVHLRLEHLGCHDLLALLRVRAVSYPACLPPPNGDPVIGPAAHLRWPRPLLVELAPALVSGGNPAAVFGEHELAHMTLCRPAWELLRLQRRFRGRVIGIAGAWAQDSGWLAQRLGLERAPRSLHGADEPQDVLRAVQRLYGRAGVDLLAGREGALRMGQVARRVWLIGKGFGLRAELLTAGVQMIELDAEDRLALADVAPLRDAATAISGDAWPRGAGVAMPAAPVHVYRSSP